MPPLTHCAKEVLKTLHKHSSTSVSNSQRVEVVPAPYGVQQSIESRRLFSHTAGSITASTALCRYSQRAHDTGTTIGGTQHEGKMATIADLRCHSLASFSTYQTAEPLLRLSGDTPDSRSSGAIRFNASRRAGCEGERDGRGSHVASLKTGGWWGACGEMCISLIDAFCKNADTRCTTNVPGTGGEDAPCNRLHNFAWFC